MAKLYRFLTGSDDSEFCHKVTQALQEGWELYGDPCYTTNPTTGELGCGQAVVKQTDAKYNPDLRLRDQ